MEGIGLQKNKGFVAMMMMIFALVFVACESESESPTASSAVKETAAVASAPVKIEGYKEAPALAKLVSAGTLKPVAERLPAKEDIMVDLGSLTREQRVEYLRDAASFSGGAVYLLDLLLRREEVSELLDALSLSQQIVMRVPRASLSVNVASIFMAF